MRETVFLTGASSGIGEAIAEALLADGAAVYGIGRDFEKTDPKLCVDKLSGWRRARRSALAAYKGGRLL